MPETKNKKNSGKRVKAPTVLQMEAVECGAASLAMILAWHGRYEPLEQLRLECGVSRDGSKAANILKAARKYGLDAQGYRLGIEDIKQADFPVIIHWNFNHFLVLEGYKNNRFFLRDPADGPRMVSEAEFTRSFTGITLTFQKTADFKPGGEKPSVLKELIRRSRGNEAAVAFTVLTGLALVLPGIIVPMFAKVFVDEILYRNNMDWLVPLLLGMIFTALLRGALSYLQGYYLLRLETKMALVSSGKFLWHALRLPVEFFTQRYAGDVSSRVQANDAMSHVLSYELARAALNIITAAFYLILMLQYSVTLSMIALLATVANLVYLKLSTDARKDKSRKLVQEQGKMAGVTMSGLQVVETLKATGSESDFFTKWSAQATKVVNSLQEAGAHNLRLAAVPAATSLAAGIAVVVAGGMAIMDGNMTTGTFVAFQSLMTSFLTPVQELFNMAGQIQSLEGAVSRLDDVYKYPLDTVFNDTDQAEAGLTKKKLAGRVEVRGLTFGYSRLEPPLLENFSLKLNPGARVALVGGTGSGKSTVAKLITGLYQPWSGEILYDDVSNVKIPRDILNNSLASVSQDITLFSGSIKDNLALWDDIVSETQMIQAAKDACIHDEITARPGGYGAELEENGANFSGGQRQRLEIARALAQNPTVLIMDEATSALDAKTEKAVDDNIRRRGYTTIIVAHRLSAIRDCDEIIVLDKGKIIERGAHDELVNASGLYTRLIQTE